MHPEVQQPVSEFGRVDLDNPEDDSGHADEDETEEPPPEDQEHLVVDDVQGEDAEGVDVGLLPSCHPSLITNSTLFCWLLKIKVRCEKSAPSTNA